MSERDRLADALGRAIHDGGPVSEAADAIIGALERIQDNTAYLAALSWETVGDVARIIKGRRVLLGVVMEREDEVRGVMNEPGYPEIGRWTVNVAMTRDEAVVKAAAAISAASILRQQERDKHE